MAHNITQNETHASDEDWRIIGGQVAKLSSTPWMAVLLANGRHTCGGSILSATKILTAAHCVKSVPVMVLSVRVGSSMSQRGGVVLRVSKFVHHARYDSPKFANDIAILTVTPRIKFKKGSISRVSLTIRQTFMVGQTLTVAGFGITSENAQRTSPRLRSVKIPFVPQSECQKSFGYLTQDMLCAGFRHGGKNSCKGDSGGPLTSGRTQIGIVSFGGFCGQKYVVYARVGYFMNWIKKNIRK